MRFVLDASFLIDAFSAHNDERRKLALRILDAIKGHEPSAPRICQVEFVNVLRRFTPEKSVRKFLGMFDFITLIGESEFFDEALEPSFRVHSRVADSYYIAAAKTLNAILLTNDRRMAENSREVGISAFYLLEEEENFFKSLGVKE